jgi:HlyD family secretion protein
MSARNRFFILLGIIFVISLIYYIFSADHSNDLVLIGTVDSNQVIVSAQVEGRIQKLLVDEGTPVKAGDLIAVLDSSELQTQEAAAAANISSLQNKVAEMQHTEASTSGATSSDVANARAKLSSAKAQLLQAKATLDRTESDSRRMIELAKAGVQSDQDRVQAETNLQAAQASVQAQQELVKAAEADLSSAIARTQQANAAKSTVQSTEADLKNAVAQKNQAAVRLGYTNVYAPVTGTVSVRAARQGEVVNIGAPIVTIVDLTDTWVRAAIPETYADHIGYGDAMRVRLPGGTITSGKVFFKGVEGDFATQRDVSRRKRDIKTIVLKIRLDNPKGAFVPGMTAEVLVSPAQMKGDGNPQNAAAAGPAMTDDVNSKIGGDNSTPPVGKQECAIEVEHIVKKYGDFTAVDDVSFNVKEGEIFGLLGPNGAGKSTLIRMMTTLIPITSGKAWVMGYDVASDPNAARRRIGVIPQALTSDLDLTVEENLNIYAKLYDVPAKERKRSIDELLGLVDLVKWRDAQTKTLSGGMRRRLEIARGLVHHPKIFFLDEPTTGLDPVSRVAVWEMLGNIKKHSANSPS